MECHFASTFHSQAYPSHFEVLSEWWGGKKKLFGLGVGEGGDRGRNKIWMNNRKMNKCIQIKFEFNTKDVENLCPVVFLFFFFFFKEAATLMERSFGITALLCTL